MSMKPRKKPELLAGGGRVWVTYETSKGHSDWLSIWPDGPRPTVSRFDSGWAYRDDKIELCVEHWKAAGLPLPPVGEAILVHLSGKVVG